MTSDANWRTLFVGREPELDQLRDAWRKITQSGGNRPQPQCVVLLAESGLGKTRLMQEFYRWLSTTQDPPSEGAPEGYWPDAFHREDESLNVNPEFSRDMSERVSIPWLWWGIRFSRPDRRNEVGSHCGLIDYQSALSAHSKAVMAARQLKVIERGAMWKTLSVLGEFVPGSGLIFGLRDAWELLTQDHTADRQLRQELNQTPGKAHERERLQAEDIALDYFCTILDSTNSESDTVPVILFLDDAQWADPVTLRFLTRLLDKARRQAWPLLVLCTHWEREWKESIKEKAEDDSRPSRLSAVVESFRRSDEEYSDWLSVRTLAPVTDLSAVIQAALPGLTSEQQNEILWKSGGNPLLLDEILLFLLRRSQFFESQQHDQPLTARGLQQLRAEKLSLERLIDDRFQSLDEEVQRALGWCSEQGQCFLMEITLASARCVDPSITEDRLRNSLSRAESPYSMIQSLGGSGRFNRSEFRQAAFHKVAREFLHFEPHELEAIQQGIRTTLIEWLLEDEHESQSRLGALSQAERLDALVMARRVFSPSTDQSEQERKAWCMAMVRLSFAYRDELLWEQAWDAAENWSNEAKDGNFTEWLTPWSLQSMCRILETNGQYSIAAQILSPVVNRLERQNSTSECAETLELLSTTLGMLGCYECADGNRDLARSAFDRCVNVHEKLISVTGKSELYLLNFSVALSDLGRLLCSEGQRHEAKAQFERSLEISRLAVEKYGNNEHTIRSLTSALVCTADFALDSNHRAEALTHYEEALRGTESLIQTFGDTPEALQDLSVVLSRLGHLDSSENRLEIALTRFNRCLEIDSQVINEFGETLQSLHAVMVSHFQIAKCHDAAGNNDESLKHFQQSLRIAEDIVGRFGTTPQSLRDLAVRLGSIGRLKLRAKNHDEALSTFQRRLEINQKIVNLFGHTPGSLSDVANAIDAIGDVELDQGFAISATATYERGLTIRQSVLDEFDATPAAIAALGWSYINLGNAAFACQAPIDAIEECYRNAEDIVKDSVAEFGESPETLGLLARCYMKLSFSGYDRTRLYDARDVISNMIKRGWATADHYSLRDRIEQEIEKEFEEIPKENEEESRMREGNWIDGEADDSGD